MAIKENPHTLISWLGQYWFLIVALFSVSVAWGQTTLKVQTLEEAVKSNAATQSQVSELKANQERIDERTKAMISNQ